MPAPYSIPSFGRLPEIERVLGGRSPMANIPRARYLRRTANSLATSTGDALLNADHPFKWMTIDPVNVAGQVQATITLDRPLSSGTPDVLTLTPGAWVPVSGRMVFCRITALDGALPVDEAATASVPAQSLGDIVFWLVAEDQPPPCLTEVTTLPRTYNDIVPGTTVPSGTGVGLPLYGANNVTIQFGDNTSLTPIVAGETSSHEVWWYLAHEMWAHNEADDFDAAGRGIASGVAATPHDAEQYEVPHNARRVYVRRIDATVFWAHFTFTTVL